MRATWWPCLMLGFLRTRTKGGRKPAFFLWPTGSDGLLREPFSASPWLAAYSPVTRANKRQVSFLPVSARKRCTHRRVSFWARPPIRLGQWITRNEVSFGKTGSETFEQQEKG